MLSVFSIWMPGLTRVIAAKLFQTRPAQTSSTIVSAICAMTSAPRSRTDCRPESLCFRRATNRSRRPWWRARPDKGRRRGRSSRPSRRWRKAPGDSARFHRARGIQSLRQARQQQVEPPAADQDAADSAERDEQERLDQLFPRNRRSAGAQGETDSHFALPRGGADELQPGDVGAGDQQDTSNARRPRGAGLRGNCPPPVRAADSG